MQKGRHDIQTIFKGLNRNGPPFQSTVPVSTTARSRHLVHRRLRIQRRANREHRRDNIVRLAHVRHRRRRQPGPAPARSLPPGSPPTADSERPLTRQDSLKAAIDNLPGVFFTGTQNSLAGSEGWILDPRLAKSGGSKAFTDALEFGHSRRPTDGSMHLFLPTAYADLVIAKRWGEPHQETDEIAGDGSVYMLIFGPRDTAEFDVVWLIVQAAYGFATGQVSA